MPAAGDLITVPTSPGALIAVEIETTNSADFTTGENEVMELASVPLEDTEEYIVGFTGNWGNDNSSVTSILGNIRDGSSSQICNARIAIAATVSSAWRMTMWGFYTPASSGNITFNLFGSRTGTGNGFLGGSATSPAILWVAYNRTAP